MAKQPARATPVAKRSAPWMPPPYTKADVIAFHAFRECRADEGEQRRVMEFILTILCERNGMSYRPGGDDGRRDSDFAEGKRWVGNEIVKLATINPSAVK